MACRVVPTLAVSTVIVVAARKALFLVRTSGQLTRSRSPQAMSIDANKTATKVVRQIMPASLGNLRFLLVPMLLGNRATLGDMLPRLFCRIARLVVVSSLTL
jgi:hypothetical protein